MADNLNYHSLEKIIEEINAYYNWNYFLEKELPLQTNDKGKYMKLYIVQKKWLDRWMELCKYNKIKEYLINHNKRRLEQNEYKEHISLTEDNNSLYLPEINDEDIYDEVGSNYNNINIDKIIDINKIYFLNDKCCNLFSQGNNQFIPVHGLYKKNKLIVCLEENSNFYVSDYSNNNKKEYNLVFCKDSRRLNWVLEEIINTNNFLDFIMNKCQVSEEINGKKIMSFKNQNFFYEEIFHKKKKKNENNLIIKQEIKSNSIKENKNNNKRNEINNILNIMKDKMNGKNNINMNINNFNNNTNDKNNGPCLVGLTNIGATCYMNAVLQCFSNIKELTNYLFKPEVTKKIENYRNSKKLSFEYLNLLKHLWLIDTTDIEYYGENKSYSPYKFKNVLGNLNPLFLKNEANDSKDFIIFIQEQFHQELNFLFERPIAKNNNININQFSDKIVKQNYFEFFMANYKSKISDLFYGTQRTFTTCENCQKSTYNYQIFSILIFPLESIRESKGIPRNGNNTVYVSIEDCFDYNQLINYFSGQNQINCNFCRQLTNAYYCTKIYTASNILILILNRGKGLEFNVNLNITEEININKYTENKESPFYFKLIGAIIHFGNSGQDGHFIAICKNKNDNQWYKYNDSIVTKSNFNEIKNIGIPYVLFYKTQY